MISIRFSAFTAVASASLFVSPAFANMKKSTAATNTGAPARSGTLVAMSGSGSLGSSSGSSDSYVGIRLFPFSMGSGKIKQGNTSVDTPSTTFRTLPKQLYFYGKFGSWVIRPTLDLDMTVQGGAVTEEGTSYLGVSYVLAPNLEVGGAVSIERSTSEPGEKQKVTSNELLIGPQAVYYTEAAGFPLELEGRVFLVFATTETTRDNTTTTNPDASGYGFEVGGTVVRELSTGLEYTGGLTLGYSSLTNKADKNNEVTQTKTDFTIIPAGLRFKF